MIGKDGSFPGSAEVCRGRKVSFMEQKNIHILVGLSPSPTNARIVRTAAGMAEAFGGRFTALYVQTQAAGRMTEADRKRLQANIRLAEKSGATVATVYGDDVSYQIAEFARLSRVTTIVIGRSNAARRHFWSKPTLTEKLTEIAPNMDIHIIPDSASETSYHAQRESFEKPTVPTLKDLAITFFILAAATISAAASARSPACWCLIFSLRNRI